MKASGLRHFRYIAFPPVVFEVPARAAEAEAVDLPEPVPTEPELGLAPESTPAALPEPAPMPPAPPTVLTPVAAPVPPPEPIPDPPSRSLPQPAVRPASGLRLLAEAAAAAAAPLPAPKPPEAPRRFALLDDIQTELRPRRARTGRRKPGDLP